MAEANFKKDVKNYKSMTEEISIFEKECLEAINFKSPLKIQIKTNAEIKKSALILNAVVKYE